MDDQLELRLLINRLEFLHADEKDLVLERLEGPWDWKKIGPLDLQHWLGRVVRGRWDPQEVARRVAGDLRFLDRPGSWILQRGTAEFPAVLDELPDPPWLLWGRGRWQEGLRVAVVGTRSPSEPAKRAATDFGRELAQTGAVVVSGLARGIDACAHWGALDGGVTVAVLGIGIDTVSPESNRRLAGRILAAEGALVSEYGPGEPALAYRFVARNRLISGLCRSVMVVQAPAKSGALITADFALDQGRDVVVHRAGLDGERGAGTRELARQGAPVLENAAGLEEVWNSETAGRAGEQVWFEGFA
ncbi:MAG: DNA-processing protein DprA [Spirochaetales bacterium]